MKTETLQRIELSICIFLIVTILNYILLMSLQMWLAISPTIIIVALINLAANLVYIYKALK